MTLNAFDVRPTCDTADVQAILPFPPNPLKHVLCAVPYCCVDVLSAILVVSLEVVGGWGGGTYTLSLTKDHRKKSHAVRSGDRGGQMQKVLSVAAA